MHGLHEEELEVLRLLDRGGAVHEGPTGGRVMISKRLFEYGLLSRKASGDLTLTAVGKKLLFRMNCATVLRTQNFPDDPAIVAWLYNSGFIQVVEEVGTLAVTARGELWLDALDEEPEERVSAVELEVRHRLPRGGGVLDV